MQWIVATNRAYIVMIPEDRQLKSMRTKYQFLLISSPPAKELAFQQAKNAHGSAYAFHGSNIENWHSIMRKGLINASGTKYQVR
jgi:poly [ADP-ribose] polymerase 6/8